MSVPVPEKFHDLFQRPILCALTTINPDGQPHSVPVWCDYDGKYTGNPVYQPYGASGLNRQMIVVEADKINGN